MFLFTAILLITAGCRKDRDIVDTNITYPEPGVFVETTIGGKVTSEAGNPVAGANVFLGSATAKTDFNGFFLFTNITVPENNAYIRVEHPSYFHGSRTMKVSAGTRNKVAIQLLSNKPTQFVDAGSGGTADYGDYSVQLPANGIVSASNGAAYTGQVGVAAKWLDPASDNFGIQMPGRLAGIRTDGSFTGMISKGMLAVELTDASGARLQIREGYEAMIKMKVDNALLGNAPAEIPLWHFDEKSGLWVEEGSAELKNGFYEGNVKHFSFWNYDVPADYVYLTVKVQDQNGNPVSDALVQLVSIEDGNYGSGYSNNTGEVSGMVPKGVQFDANVRFNFGNCTSSVYEETVGPFTQTEMLTITVNSSLADYVYTISGDLVDCNGQPVTSGYIFVPNFYDQYIIDNQGHFEFTQYFCSQVDNLEITGYNTTTIQSSNPVTVNLVSGINNVGSIQVCNTLNEYISYKAPTFDMIYEDPNCHLHLDTLILQGGGGVPQFKFATLELFSGIGTYHSDSFFASGLDSNNESFYHFCQQSACLTIDVTEYTGPGGIIAGTYSGTAQKYTPQGYIDVPVSGSFRTILQ